MQRKDFLLRTVVFTLFSEIDDRFALYKFGMRVKAFAYKEWLAPNIDHCRLELELRTALGASTGKWYLWASCC